MRSSPFSVAAVIALALLGVGPRAVRAEHGSPLLLVKPSDGALIPRNAELRLVSYNGEDQLIWLLGNTPAKISARLESAAGPVPLRPRRYLTDHDGYGRAMIGLVPARLLEPDTEYRLVVDVPAEGWHEQLATFVTTREIDRVAPRWLAEPAFDQTDRTFIGRIDAADELIEVVFTARPRGGGAPRKTFVLFDLTQRCIEGPTADYRVVIFNSQCDDMEERQRPGAVCDSLYYFIGWRGEAARYRISAEVRDLSGNLRRARRAAAAIDLDSPFGLCLELGTEAETP